MGKPLLSLKVTLPFLVAYYVGCATSVSTYDFIVVGAGAGGAAVTRRLAENGKFTVLLCESGDMPKKGQDIPSNAAVFMWDMDLNFRYPSVPLGYGAALRTNGVVNAISGRVVGGTTTQNTMWFNRGHPKDWDYWANVTGDESWNYGNMLKYFKRVEDYMGDFPSEEQHGTGGPITVSRPSYAPGLDIWLAAGKELGYSVGDPNGPQEIGFSPVEFTKRNGRRVSSYTGYLDPIVDTHQNLDILISTDVTQIIFERNRAVGIRYISGDTKPNEAYASKEIIVCAGAYGSPLLLQHSGIGPRDVLSAAKIPIVKELPVGQNLQNHPAINLNFIINNASAVLNITRDLTPENLEYFNTYGDGPYSNSRGATGQAMLSSSIAIAEGDADWPDIQLAMSHSTLPHITYQNLHTTVTYNSSAGEVPMSTSMFYGRIKSRGSIKVNPNNPESGTPIIEWNYFSDSRDIEIFLDGIEETLHVFENTSVYNQLAARYAPVVLPECQQFPERSRDYWICYVKQTINAGCHPGGTNRMGRRTDPTSVVDSQLRVIGVEGLRVADASIMPLITNANPQAAVYGIAEKAAEMILNQWKEGQDHAGASQNMNHPLRLTSRWNPTKIPTKNTASQK